MQHRAAQPNCMPSYARLSTHLHPLLADRLNAAMLLHRCTISRPNWRYARQVYEAINAAGHQGQPRIFFRLRDVAHLFDDSLKAVQKIGGTLRMRGGAEDRALVVLQNLEPALDIRRMIGTRFWREFKVGA